MTRTRRVNKDLPPRVYLHGKTYRYVPRDPETRGNLPPISLGHDRATALQRWAELTSQKQAIIHTCAELWERYERDELPRKSPASQRSNRQQWSQLAKVFGQVAIHAITAQHGFQYLDLRGKVSPTQANREIALFRHLFTKARHWGLCADNPLLHLQYRNPEPPRTRYVTDDELQHAIERAPAWLAILMWLGYLTGLRRGDLLKLTRFDCKEDGIHWLEQKTHKRVVIAWTHELRLLVERALKASPDQRLFPITDSAVDSAWGRFQRLLAADGKERFLMRDLRAKHATDFEASGGNATTQLGHSSRDLTRRHYLRQPRIMTPLR